MHLQHKNIFGKAHVAGSNTRRLHRGSCQNKKGTAFSGSALASYLIFNKSAASWVDLYRVPLPGTIKWRRGEDSNLRYHTVHMPSKQAPSTTRTPLRGQRELYHGPFPFDKSHRGLWGKWGSSGYQISHGRSDATQPDKLSSNSHTSPRRS